MLASDDWTTDDRRPSSHMIRRRGMWIAMFANTHGPLCVTSPHRTRHPNGTCIPNSSTDIRMQIPEKRYFCFQFRQQQSSEHYRTNLFRPSASNSKRRVIIASTTHTLWTMCPTNHTPHAISVGNLRFYTDGQGRAHTFTSSSQPLLPSSSRLRPGSPLIHRRPRELGMCVHRAQSHTSVALARA